MYVDCDILHLYYNLHVVSHTFVSQGLSVLVGTKMQQTTDKYHK